MKFEEIISELGEFGPYQKQIYFLTCLAPLCVSMQVLAGVFTQATPDHRCAIPGLANDTYASQGAWHDALVEASIPRDDDEDVYDQCTIRRVPGGLDNDTVRCDKWVYSKHPFESTVVTDRDLVCEDSILATYASMILMCGMLFGSLILGILSDILGRKKVMIPSALCLTATSLGVAWANSYPIYVVLKFFTLFFSTGMILPGFVMGMEIVGPSKRRLAGNIANFFWCTGQYMEAGLAYGLRDWHHLQIAISGMPALAFLILLAFLPESPRWLLQKGKTEEAGQIIRKIAARNGVTLSEKSRVMEDVNIEVKGTSVWHVFTSGSLVVRVLIMFYCWLVSSMVYYGLSLNVGSLVGNIYLNFFLSGLAELAAYVFSLYFMDITGRKLMLCSMMFLGGTSCLATMFPVMYGGEEIQWVNLILSLVGKFGITSAFAVVYVFAAELFPTTMRNSAIGLCSLCARVGGIMAPYVADLGKIVDGDLGIALPLIIFGGLCLAAGFLVFLLPETRHAVLPDTLEDAKNFGKLTGPNSYSLNSVLAEHAKGTENPSFILEKTNEQ